MAAYESDIGHHHQPDLTEASPSYPVIPLPTPESNIQNILQAPLRKRHDKDPKKSHLRHSFSELNREQLLRTFHITGWNSYESEETSGIVYTTREQGDWLIVPPAWQKIIPLEIPYILNGAKEALGERQSPHRAHEREIGHEENILFFDANWEVLTPIFFDIPIPDKKRLNRFREVNLNDYALEQPGQEQTDTLSLDSCGTIDFIGVSADGQIVVVEFSARGVKKSKQLAKQTKGLKEIFRTHNHGTIPNISPYVGKYSSAEGLHTISFKRPSDLYFPEQFVQKDPEIIIYEMPQSTTSLAGAAD